MLGLDKMYDSKKANFINTDISAQIDPELQDITPSHDSPLSSLFSDPDKMKIWLVFIDSTEDMQDEM